MRDEYNQASKVEEVGLVAGVLGKESGQKEEKCKKKVRNGERNNGKEKKDCCIHGLLGNFSCFIHIYICFAMTKNAAINICFFSVS